MTLDSWIETIARAIASAGGRALLVGGYVRDLLLGRASKDLDFEVFGLPLESLDRVLGTFGEVIHVGRSFGVLRVKGIDVDFSLPRHDSKVGRGHRGFIVELDPELSFADAARRRDLTMNSIGLDPLTGELLDPWGGRADMERRRLRATDPNHFAEDSLRGLRVAQFAARFEMAPDAELEALCASLDLSELPGERIYEEYRKLLLQGVRPSVGFEFLRRTGLLRFFPEIAAMVGVPQDPEWHPEGTVWEHTLLVVDEAARARTGDEARDLAVLFGALCHDFGKPATTFTDEKGRVRSPEHEEAGVEPTVSFLERLRAPKQLVDRVCALVRHHLAPAQFVQAGASAKAYRRLARRLDEAGADGELLYRVAEADHFGRTTPDALAREFPAGAEFRRRLLDVEVEGAAVVDVVLGRHLIARGMAPGIGFGPILARAREVQEETGWLDPDRILGVVLAERSAAPSSSNATRTDPVSSDADEAERRKEG
jgi:tRNA nucleotidyltransferase (CCA-adding enzyme)